MERYEFKNLQQRKDETIDQLGTRLQQKTENWEFVDKDGKIRSQIIQGCLSRKLHLKCLEDEKQLIDLLTMARTMEIAERQAKAMDRNINSNITIYKIKYKSAMQKRYV